MIGLVPDVVPLPAETNDLRIAVREFLAADRKQHRWEPRVDSWISSWDPGFSRRLAGQGWVGMTIPTEFGGPGRSHLERFVVTEELLAQGAPVAAHWVADRQVAPALVRHGNTEQRERYLGRIADGSCYFAIGMSEPEAGSDLASVRTRGVRTEGGWHVSGTKVWTSGAHHSEAFFVLARTSDLDPAHRHDGLSQFLVPLDSTGIEIRPIKLMTGQHHFNEVVLDRVFVPDEMVVGTVGSGWRQVGSELGFERSGPERFLSPQPLLDRVATRLDPANAGAMATLGGLVAELIALRQLSGSVARALSGNESADLSAAVVKEIGTTYEQRLVSECAELVPEIRPDPDSADDLSRLLAEGLLHAPGFTLRGGTSEILRGVIARGLGLR
ncbi:acyl-CoA dehydrogenase family protein [Rhodococcus sp. DMU1]|uniref:acyl-CoA dehydrogenase family protein n=1 Tax=Rhodococcus sp. DMU1 TaxID=2722825 RepID=UPI00143E5AD8|nr:acyl-CoA dehydrogenase family protein [Rhodococcus sp. DMU1]QIX53766.1 acyl-CoA dehydrogenase [Rhodococcus sp. DMU1]